MSWTPGGRIRKGLCPSSSGFWQLGLLGMGVALEMADVLNRCWEWGQEVGEAPGRETSPIYKEKVLAQGALGQRFPWTKGPWEREQCFQALVPSSNGSSGQRGGRWGNVQMSIHRRLPNLDTTCLNKKKIYWLYKQYSTIFITATYLLASSLRYKLMTTLIFTDCFR